MIFICLFRNIAKEIGCFCILATHFHELTVLADEVATVKNFHVTAIADAGGLTMLYKIEKGPCDRSFGIHVASQVDFPPEVIEKATGMVRKLEDFSSVDQEDGNEAAVMKRREYKAVRFCNFLHNIFLYYMSIPLLNCIFT